LQEADIDELAEKKKNPLSMSKDIEFDLKKKPTSNQMTAQDKRVSHTILYNSFLEHAGGLAQDRGCHRSMPA
jgi:hypothetical protein